MRALTTFTVFHVEEGSRWWAFQQMGTAAELLRDVPGLRFSRLMGTGARISGVAPDWGRYVLLCVFCDEARAREFLRDSAFMRLYRERGASAQTTLLETLRSRGSWDGEAPFGEPRAEPPAGAVAVVTRATLRPLSQLAFWRSARATEPEVLGAEGLRWALGMAELPVLRSATFSVWESAEAVARFARSSPAHRAATEATRQERWYREELFARFAVVDEIEERA